MYGNCKWNICSDLKVWSKVVFNFFERNAHFFHGCIYLIKITVKQYCEILLQFKIIINNISKCHLFLWWQSWIFSSNYCSLQCHMILQKLGWFVLWSVLKSVMLLNVFVETFFFQDSKVNRKFKRAAFIWNRNLLWHYKCLYCHF